MRLPREDIDPFGVPVIPSRARGADTERRVRGGSDVGEGGARDVGDSEKRVVREGDLGGTGGGADGKGTERGGGKR